MRRDNTDPYHRPPFSFQNRLARFCWGIVYVSLFRLSPRPFHAWRRMLLRAFGAKLAHHTYVYPSARIWAPWNLACDEYAAIADGSIIYNPELVHMGTHSIVSQQAYICGATHDYDDPTFPLIAAPITLGSHSWVCARATVQPGVTLGEGSILALGAVATRSLDAWTVYGGVPARRIKTRNQVSTMVPLARSSAS
jgi:putative colanic acid biosynthesis acetyltransferase WcaF